MSKRTLILFDNQKQIDYYFYYYFLTKKRLGKKVDNVILGKRGKEIHAYANNSDLYEKVCGIEFDTIMNKSSLPTPDEVKARLR